MAVHQLRLEFEFRDKKLEARACPARRGQQGFIRDRSLRGKKNPELVTPSEGGATGSEGIIVRSNQDRGRLKLEGTGRCGPGASRNFRAEIGPA